MALEVDFILLKDVKSLIKNLNLRVIVLEVGRPNKTKEGHEVRSCKVGDISGCINLSVWDEIGRHIQCSDILRIKNAYCGHWKGCPTLYIGKSGTLTKIGEFTMLFNELINFSQPDPEFLSRVISKTANSFGNPRKLLQATEQSTSCGDGNSSPQFGRHKYNQPNQR